MKEPLVCVILVNYNGYEDTVACIQSLRQIDYTNYKIIVIDNGSTELPSEEQIQYIKKHSKYVVSDNNLGFSGGNNLGMKIADTLGADYYMLLNNDTVVDTKFMTKLVQTAEEKENVGIVTGKIFYYDHPRHIWYAGGEVNSDTCSVRHRYWDEVDYISDQEVEQITFATGCLWLLPVKTVKEIGTMDEKLFLYSEDTEYSFRLIDKGYKIYYNNSAIIYHKVSKSTSILSDIKQYYLLRNEFYIINKYAKKRYKAFLKKIYVIIKQVLKKELRIRVVLRAYSDYKNNNMGVFREGWY